MQLFHNNFLYFKKGANPVSSIGNPDNPPGTAPIMGASFADAKRFEMNKQLAISQNQDALGGKGIIGGALNTTKAMPTEYLGTREPSSTRAFPGTAYNSNPTLTNIFDVYGVTAKDLGFDANQFRSWDKQKQIDEMNNAINLKGIKPRI